ncbi:AAA family ATPase [Neobacillus sp. YIM B06451]|uniref:AAA family ATPase n=1 Tax=Neobacillus sp. YIM B06451 TaxID=3070994 RepID=UPI00292E99EC|nr:AAA family ATPase [Neobacillus sp. YIM B06451]
MRKIFIVSGPAGVGKSTIARRLAEQFSHSAYIEGDLVNHMVVGGHIPPWESQELESLVWENIIDLGINFVQAGKDVVIDYISFPEDVRRFSEKVGKEVGDVEIHYVVLWAERDELLQRDSLRAKPDQMGARCLELVDEFLSKGVEPRFFYDTTRLSKLDDIVTKIMENPSYKFSWKVGAT